MGPSLSLFLLPVPVPSPELWLGQQHSRQRDTRGSVPSTRGHQHVPVTAAMEPLMGATKEQPQLHHPGGESQTSPGKFLLGVQPRALLHQGAIQSLIKRFNGTRPASWRCPVIPQPRC